MHLLFLLFPVFLLPYRLLPVTPSQELNYTLALTVRSTTEKEKVFDLTIEGEKIGTNGEATPFQLKKTKVHTPYRLDLGNGRFDILIVRQSKEEGMMSRIQTLQDGKEMGYCENDVRKTKLGGAAGTCYAGGED